MTNVTFAVAVKHRRISSLIVILVKYFGLILLLCEIVKTTRKSRSNRVIFYLLFIPENNPFCLFVARNYIYISGKNEDPFCFNSYLTFLKNKVGIDKRRIEILSLFRALLFCLMTGIIQVKVGVISRSRRLRLITLTETLIIWDITKTESNNCLLYIGLKKIKTNALSQRSQTNT